MANEFIARKGLVVLSNGARVTGSLGVQGNIDASGYNVTASNLQLLGSASIAGDITLGGNLTVGNADIDVVRFLAEVSSSIIPDINNSFDLGSGSKSWRDLYVSGTAYIGTVQASNINLNSITVVNDLTVQGNTNLGNASTDIVTITGSVRTLGPISATSVSGSFSGSGAQITNIPNSGLVNSSVTVSAGNGLSGGGSVSLGGSTTVTLDTSSTHFISGSRNAITFTDTAGASGIDFTYVAGTASAVLQNSAVTVTAGSGLSGGGSVSLGSTTTVTLDTSSVHFLDGVKKELNTEGVISSSAQVDVRNTTGITTIATTGSNTFTGIQTITNSTNSTVPSNGALIVSGGLGIGGNVNVSGSLTVVGLLTAVSTSIQYVTSSQLFVADNKIVVQTNDIVRFGGLSVYDSGSTSPTTASIYWDSLNHNFIYENLSGSTYNSGKFIAGPQNYSSLGNEPGLTVGRVPVASGDDHIDSRLQSSSIRVDFPSRLTHVEAGLQVTGSVSSSVGFWGDGSNLTGIVTNLVLTGSQGGTGTVSLKTQGLIVSGANGVGVTVSGQTITVSGSNATTTTKGVASFNSTNFTVAGGAVSSNNITLNNGTVTLGGTRNITLQDITTYGGATTTDAVTFTNSTIISSTLYTGSINSDADIGTEVVATVSTGSYDAAFFDYVIKKSTNFRAGTVMAVWEAGSTNVEFTDTSTNDLGNTTDVVFTVDILAATARLKATAASNDWYIKTAVRAI